MKIAKRNRLKAKIDKNAAEIQPTIDAFNEIDAEIAADLEKLEQEKKDRIYSHVMSVFGEDMPPEDFAREFDKLINDQRNRGFVEHLAQLKAMREASTATEDTAT